jgi:hypothetical protein
MNVKTQWQVEKSHLVAIPEKVMAETVSDLRRWVQEKADFSTNAHPFGEISFRYELNDNEEPVIIHAYFSNRHGKQQRFMRLRKRD